MGIHWWVVPLYLIEVRIGHICSPSDWSASLTCTLQAVAGASSMNVITMFYLLKRQHIIQPGKVFTVIYLITNKDSVTNSFRFNDTVWNNSEAENRCSKILGKSKI